MPVASRWRRLGGWLLGKRMGDSSNLRGSLARLTRKPSHRARLLLELLEDRVVMAESMGTALTLHGLLGGAALTGTAPAVASPSNCPAWLRF